MVNLPVSCRIAQADCVQWLGQRPAESAQLIIADPPYYRVLTGESWDNAWPDEKSYLAWCDQWMVEGLRILRKTGLFYIFGQPGKREQVFLRLVAQALERASFQDLIIWDRVVGYNERRDSFTPGYEMLLVLRKGDEPYFDKDAVREPYDAKTRGLYLRDKRYKDMEARRQHLERGKYATNLWKIASLKGSSKEKVGHPTQKPLALVERIVASSSRVGDLVVDPFCGSGTSAMASVRLGRHFAGCELEKSYCEMAESRLKAAGFREKNEKAEPAIKLFSENSK